MLEFWPDLGKYSGAVTSAYVVSLILLFGLILQSWVAGRKVKRELDRAERRVGTK